MAPPGGPPTSAAGPEARAKLIHWTALQLPAAAPRMTFSCRCDPGYRDQGIKGKERCGGRRGTGHTVLNQASVVLVLIITY